MAQQASDPDQRYALLTSFVVLYGRPFKQRASVRLKSDFVPKKFSKIHETLIAFRDQTFAHMDAGETRGLEGATNKPRLTAHNGGIVGGINYFTFTPKAAKEVEELISVLRDKCIYHFKKIMAPVVKGGRVPDGVYEVSLADGDIPILVPFVEFVPIGSNQSTDPVP